MTGSAAGTPDPAAGVVLGAGAVSVGCALERGVRRLGHRLAPETARREARLLLAGLLEISPGALWLQRERRLTETEWHEYEGRLRRRLDGEPLQYIEGWAAFRNLRVRVDRSVLIPRPETERLVQAVLDRCRERESLVGLDLGTGSGAIAISLIQEGPFARVVAVDISASALNVARDNITDTGVSDRVELRRGSFYDALASDERFDLIISNPPYVAEGEADDLPPEVRDWEPSEALYAGPSGREAIDHVIEGAPRHLKPGGLLALEIAPRQAPAVLHRLRKRAWRAARVTVIDDLSGHPRVVLAERGRIQSRP